jgi:hypothetical protein
MLPLLKGWRFDPADLTGQVYTRRTPIANIHNEKGWFLWALATFSNPRANIRVTYDEYYSSNISPIELFAAGLTTSNSSGFWVGTYSIPLSQYCIFFTPNYPYPFSKSLLIEIEPPAGGTVSVLNYGHLLIRVDNDGTFERSLKNVLASE